MTQSSRYCKRCQRHTLHGHAELRLTGFHVLFTVLTCGLWAPFFILHILLVAMSPWRCQFCGKARMI